MGPAAEILAALNGPGTVIVVGVVAWAAGRFLGVRSPQEVSISFDPGSVEHLSSSIRAGILEAVNLRADREADRVSDERARQAAADEERGPADPVALADFLREMGWRVEPPAPRPSDAMHRLRPGDGVRPEGPGFRLGRDPTGAA